MDVSTQCRGRIDRCWGEIEAYEVIGRDGEDQILRDPQGLKAEKLEAPGNMEAE